jgi:hypothetical protein
MSGFAEVSGSFVREHLRAPLTLGLLVSIPAFFVLIFAGVLGDFARALGGTLAARSGTAISAGWAAAFLSGTLAFFQVTSSRAADRRLTAAGLGATRVALSRIVAALVLGATVSAAAFVTLWLRSGIGHPLHAAVAIFAFAAIYIGIGAHRRARIRAAGGIAAGAARVDDRHVLRATDDQRRRARRIHTDQARRQPPDRRRRRGRLAGRRLDRRRGDRAGGVGRGARGILAGSSNEVGVMTARARTATVMAFRDQRRRPLVLILLAIVPAAVILWSVAITQTTPRLIELPGGEQVSTTMKSLHGPEMAVFTVAFVAALVGVFVMQSALQGDRRLVVAGFRPGEAVLARLTVLITATAVVVAVSALVTALSFTPASWPPVIAALALAALIYAAIGALAGAILDKLAATYLILFLVMTDIGIVQDPMFHAAPGRLAVLLPGYGPARAMFDGAYAPGFHAAGQLLLGAGWLIALGAVLFVLLGRAIGAKAAR